MDPDALIREARRNPRVLAGAPYVSGQAMLTHEDSVRGVIARGIDPAAEPSVADFLAGSNAALAARLKPGEFGLLIGRELSRQLSVDTGDRLTLIAPLLAMACLGLLISASVLAFSLLQAR